jgi:hypothetical protein
VLCHGTPVVQPFVWYDLAAALAGRQVIVWDMLCYG